MRACCGYTASIHNAGHREGSTADAAAAGICCCCPLENPLEAVKDKWLRKSPWPGGEERSCCWRSNRICSVFKSSHSLQRSMQMEQPSHLSLDYEVLLPGRGSSQSLALLSHYPYHWVMLSTFQLHFLQWNSLILSCLHPTVLVFFKRISFQKA